ISTNITFNHGLFDNLYSFIVGTNLTFFDEDLVQPYKNEINEVNNNVQLSKNWNNIYSNNWKQQSSTIRFENYQNFENLIQKLDPNNYQTYLNNWYANNYYKFLDVLNDELRTFMQDSVSFEFNYQINANQSTGISKFITEIYNDSNNPLKNEIFTSEDDKYFSGTFKIPLIPFITVLPKGSDKLDLEQTKAWALDYKNWIDPQQSEVNISSVKSIIRNTFNKLSEKSNNHFNQLLESNKVSTNVRNKYYSEYDIEYFLKNVKSFDFTKSSNFTLTDNDSNSFILTKSKYYSDKKVNDVVIYEGSQLIDNKINETYIEIDNISNLYLKWREVLELTSPPANSSFLNIEEYQKDYFINDNNFFVIMNLLSQSKINTSENIIEEFYSYINQVIDIRLFNENFSKWKEVTKNFITNYLLALISWNGGGYNLEFTRDNGFGVKIDFGGNYYEPSSFMSVLGLNYTQLKNNSKQIIDSEFAIKAANLPYKTFDLTEDEILNNYEKYKDHFIYNPYTEKVEFYNDFLDWMSKVHSKYKVSVNGDEFIIIGKGISTEFAYPILSDNREMVKSCGEHNNLLISL
ncbi:MAG: hypothetical protein K2L64_00515, partial [Ureaplasma sp.]|nr:hypothetical protein [Ureaplasma sp.]